MYNFLLRNGTTIAFVVGFLASLILIFAVVSGSGDLAVDNHSELLKVSQFGIAVKIGVIFVILGLIAIALGGVAGFITNPKAAVKFLVVAAGLAILTGIFYAMSKEETSGVVRALNEEYDIQGVTTRLIGGGILLTLVLMAVAFVTVLLAEIRNAFK